MKHRNVYLNILLKPYYSDKIILLSKIKNVIVFKVSRYINKIQITQVVSKIFNVQVKKICILNVKRKKIRSSNRIGYIKGWKKAYIYLDKQSSIPLYNFQK